MSTNLLKSTVICAALYGFAAFGEESVHDTQLKFSQGNGIVAVGEMLDAQIDSQSVPTLLRRNPNTHFCAQEPDQFRLRIDEGEWQFFRLSAFIQTGYDISSVPPGKHSLEIEKYTNYCIHELDESGWDRCLGNKQYKEQAKGEFSVVEVDKLTGPNSFTASKQKMRDCSPFFTESTKTLSLPLGKPGDYAKFTAEPYPNGKWPERCPDWRHFGGQFKLDDGGSSILIATDKPFNDYLCVSCGSQSSINIGLSVIGVERLVVGEISMFNPNAFNELPPYFKWSSDSFRVVNISMGNATVMAIPTPDVANTAARNISALNETKLPDEWKFTCNGNKSKDSRLVLTTDLSKGGRFNFTAECGYSKKDFMLYAAGVDISGEGAFRCYNQQSSTKSQCVILPLAIDESDDNIEDAGSNLVKISLYPIHLAELNDIILSGNPENPEMFSYGELHVKANGVRLWFDSNKSEECLDTDNIPCDRQTDVYAEATELDQTNIILEYSSLVFDASKSLSVTPVDLRPDISCNFILNNDDNDDAGPLDAKFPKDIKPDYAQDCVQGEDDLRQIVFNSPKISIRIPTSDKQPDISLALESQGGIRLWQKANKSVPHQTEPHYFPIGQMPGNDALQAFVEGVECSGIDACGVLAAWIINGNSFKYRIPFTVLDAKMAVDGTKTRLTKSDSMNFNDFGSEQPGDFGCYGRMFWINNDTDCKQWDSERIVTSRWHEDDEGNHPNSEDDTIGYRTIVTNGITTLTDISNYCLRDLEDFSRLHIKLDPNFRTIIKSKKYGKLSVSLGNAPINIFKATKPGMNYLDNKSDATEQAQETCLLRVPKDCNGQIPLKRMNFKGEVSPFIWEAREAGRYILELTLSLNKNNKETIIGKRHVRLDLRDIQEFYDVWNQNNINEADVNKPKHTDDIMQNDHYILLVHGFNVTDLDAAYWPGTMYKRLWWSGFTGRVGMYRWDCKIVSTRDIWHANFDVYDESELRAWKASSDLNRLIQLLRKCHCNTKDAWKLHILAHSQGNIVTCEALRTLPENEYVDSYIASQASISTSYFMKVETPYFRKRMYRLTNLSSWLSNPDIKADYPGWAIGANGESRPFHYNILANHKARLFVNCYNAKDWALHSAIGSSWEDNNAMKPNIGYRYRGDLHKFALDGSCYFFTINDNQTLRKLRFPAPSNNYGSSEVADSHLIFAYAAQAWGRALGTQGDLPFVNESLNLATIGFGKDHYSHSKQFRSNMAEMNKYWEFINSKITKSDKEK